MKYLSVIRSERNVLASLVNEDFTMQCDDYLHFTLIMYKVMLCFCKFVLLYTRKMM
jgi:hypothetical protein